MSKSQSALAKVQDLYLIQVELWRFLDTPAAQVTPDAIAVAKKNLRAFSALLGNADWGYMGGEDVVATLRAMRTEVDAKIKRVTARPARRGISVTPRFSANAKQTTRMRKSTSKASAPKKAVSKKAIAGSKKAVRKSAASKPAKAKTKIKAKAKKKSAPKKRAKSTLR